MLRNKIVAHFKNRKIVKGESTNFFPNKTSFTLQAPTGESANIDIEKLKAVFFTKDLDGNQDYQYNYSDDIPGAGRKMEVEFFDGERIIGYSMGYSPDRHGFFLTPADLNGNNERMFIVSSSARTIEFL